MTPRRQLLINVVSVVIVGAAIGVVTNYATDTVPAFFQDQSNVWLTFGVLVLLAIVVQLVAREKQTPSLPLVRPRFVTTPSSLRRPSPGVVLRGRDTELGRLAVTGLVVVCGPGGMGKTTLAATAAEQAEERGQAVFWIRWRDEVSLAAQMADVAKALGLPEGQIGAVQQSGGSLVDLIWGHLEKTPGWIVVLDNVDQTDGLCLDGPVREYRGWVRPSGAGLLLVTSRDRSADTWGEDARLVRLEPLTDGAGVLLDLAPRGGDPTRLAKRLGGLPLALHAAGTAVAQPTARWSTFDEYLAALDDIATGTLVGQTWELSLNQLAAEGQPLARMLLRALSLLAEAPIPREVIGPGLLPADQQATVSEVDAALAGLERYGLVDVPTSGRTPDVRTVVLHPLVRETTRLLVDEPDRWHEAIEQHLVAQAEAGVEQKRAGWPLLRYLTPHLLTLDASRVADTLTKVGGELFEAGVGAPALALHRHVLDDSLNRIGPDDTDTLKHQNSVAAVLIMLGRYEEAERLNRQTLDVCLVVLGPDHEHTVLSQNNLAYALARLGRVDESERLFRCALEACTRAFGRDHPFTLGSQANFGNALSEFGRYDEALPLLQRAVEDDTRVHGADSRETLISQNNLAYAYLNLGLHREAIRLSRRTLESQHRVLGADHPDTLMSQQNLARSLRALGHRKEADELDIQTLEARLRVLGPDHPDTLTSQERVSEIRRPWWRRHNKRR